MLTCPSFFSRSRARCLFAVSQSLPPIPHLEAMYRHAAASTRLLGELGHGAGVMIHPRDEILGRDTHWD